MKTSSRRQGWTAVIGFESGPSCRFGLPAGDRLGRVPGDGV